jgi:hypothetical protein
LDEKNQPLCELVHAQMEVIQAAHEFPDCGPKKAGMVSRASMPIASQVPIGTASAQLPCTFFAIALPSCKS